MTAFKSAPCSSCGAPMIWALTEKGRACPFDAQPSPAGTHALEKNKRGEVLCFGVPAAERATSKERLYVSHFASCPAAASFRRTPARPAP